MSITENPGSTGEVGDADRLFAHYCRLARRIYWSFSNDASGKLSGQAGSGGKALNPRWDGGEDAYGREHRPVWPLIVKTAVGAKIELFDLIAAQFNASTLGARPTPDKCHGPKALRNVEVSLSAAKHTLKGLLIHYQDKFLVSVGMRIRGKMTVDEINDLTLRTVVDMTADLDPLYRYCEAFRLGVEDGLRPDVRLVALAIYMNKQAAYDAVWQGFIPRELSRRAANVRASILEIKN